MISSSIASRANLSPPHPYSPLALWPTRAHSHRPFTRSLAYPFTALHAATPPTPTTIHTHIPHLALRPPPRHILLLCTAELFAAVAPVAGIIGNGTAIAWGYDSYACPAPPRPLPVLHFHGLTDPLVPWVGNPLLGFPSIVRERDGKRQKRHTELPYTHTGGVRCVRACVCVCVCAYGCICRVCGKISCTPPTH